MPEYPGGLLGRPVGAALDAIGGALLDAAAAARLRLGDPADEEALHDFRVALRRLRSVERAFRRRLPDPMPKPLRTRLRDLARATNGARDAEVQLAWLARQDEGQEGERRVGFAWVVEHLTERRDREYAASLRIIEAEFAPAEGGARAWLGAGWSIAPGGETFAAVLGDLVAEHLAALEGRLAAIHAPEDETAVHQARIAAKRLRYLLELVAAELGAARDAVTRLKGLQDVLGELHDRQVLDHELAVAVELAAAERGDAVPGVRALAGAGREAQHELFAAFAAEWRDGGLTELRGMLDVVLQVLRAHRAGVPLEVERKFLLSGLPQRVDGAPSVAVEQGWLPGERLQERLRRVSDGAGERYYRTVKLGEGVTRVELEEEASADLFGSLWPLTEGRRLRKRRYYLPDGERRWEIDEFLDRDLVLAEVEVADPATVVEPPAWLAPLIVREVTGEPEYQNVNLAR